MNGQASLFDPNPPRDIWTSEQLWRMSNEGFYWTPEGPRNGPYKAPEPQEKTEAQRARPRRTQPSRKKVLA